MNDSWPEYGQGEIPFLEPVEPIQRQWQLLPADISSDSNRRPEELHSHRVASGPMLFLLLPVATLVFATALWGGPHHLWDSPAWRGLQPFHRFDFIADGAIGRAFELLFWGNCAVQLRWIGHTASANRRERFAFRSFFLMWLFDTLNTPFISWIVLVLLQGLTITFANGLRVSLADADIVLFSAISALLGMSVRETRALLTRMAHAWFKRMSDDKSASPK